MRGEAKLTPEDFAMARQGFEQLDPTGEKPEVVNARAWLEGMATSTQGRPGKPRFDNPEGAAYRILGHSEMPLGPDVRKGLRRALTDKSNKDSRPESAVLEPIATKRSREM